VWAILGWATRQLGVHFATPPRAEVLAGRAAVRFRATSREVAYPVFAEAYVTRLLDRDEFRAHCDHYKTRERILAHL
jgi:putative hemolysin